MSDKPEHTGTAKSAARVVDASADALLHGADRAREGFDRGVDGFKRGTVRAKEGVTSAIDTVDEAVGSTREFYDDLREKPLPEVVDDVTELVRRHPGKALVVAGVAGFLLGSLFSRRS